MAVSESYREFVIEQLSNVVPISYRKMFGGIGVYSEGLFFAIMGDDRLYFKVDDSNYPDYAAHGMAQFMNLRYYEVPADILEDEDELSEWVEKALAVAALKKKKQKKKKKKQ